MFAFLSHAGSHKESLREKEEAASRKISLFGNERGNSNYDSNCGSFIEETTKWLEMMKNRKISWCYHASTDFAEDATILKPNSSTTGNRTDSNFTESGKFIKNYFSKRK